MFKKPPGESRPADTVGLAMHVAGTATREIDHSTPEEDALDKADRAASMMTRRRSEFARLAAEARSTKS